MITKNKSPAVTIRHTCRVCGGSELKQWVHLPMMPLTEDLQGPDDPGKEFLYDIDVYYCAGCRTSQLLHDVDLREYLSDYSFVLKGSEFSSQFKSRLARVIYEKYGLSRGSTVIEIGSGDGSQLAFFKQLGVNVFGFEPSKVLCEQSVKSGIPVHQGLFTPGSIGELPQEFRSPDVLLLTYTFDHIPEPAAFLEAARELLKKKNGALVIEVHDLDKIMERREYCLFAHEHFTYFSKATLEGLLTKSGFRLISADLLPEKERRGNSLLIDAVANASSGPVVQAGSRDTGDPSRYAAFNPGMLTAIKRLDDFVDDCRKGGKRIAGYGAGGRGVMTLAAMHSGNKLAYVCDINQNFHGKITPKSHVRIVAPEYLREEPVDALLVFSYGYIEEIRKHLASIVSSDTQITSLLELL
jgi:SAM-dependent methyltransferase